MRSAAVEVVERKTMARSPRRKGASSVSAECSACSSVGLKIFAGEEFLEAKLCDCLPTLRKLEELDRETGSRLMLWKHWKDIPVSPEESRSSSRPGARSMWGVRPNFSESEVELFSRLAGEMEEVTSYNEGVKKIRERYERLVALVRAARIPGRYAPLLEQELPSQASEWVEQFKSGRDVSSLVLFGKPGTGKTALASMLAMRIIMETGKSVVFFPTELIFEWRKRTITADFGTQQKTYYQNHYDELISEIRTADIVILDDVGRQKPSESIESAYTEIIDLRYPSGKPTIYTTNHWTSVECSLDGRTLEDRIGSRAADRLRETTVIEVKGPSRREENSLTQEVIPKDVQDSFVTKSMRKDETSCMWWLARNPIFQVVDDHERARLTDVNGEDIDQAPRLFKGVWHEGDQLTVFGPVLGMDDQLLYLALVELLHDHHRLGKKGLTVETTIAEIREKLGLKSRSTRTTQQLLKRLTRLKRVSVRFKSYDNRSWIGGFVDSVAHDGRTKDYRIIISMNPCMIRFYESPAYFSLRLNDLRMMSDWGKVFYLFVESHSDDRKHFPVETLAQIAGKSNADKKRLKRTAQDVLKEQKALGYQTDEAHIDAKGIIHTCRTPRTPAPIVSSPAAS